MISNVKLFMLIHSNVTQQKYLNSELASEGYKGACKRARWIPRWKDSSPQAVEGKALPAQRLSTPTGYFRNGKPFNMSSKTNPDPRVLTVLSLTSRSFGTGATVPSSVHGPVRPLLDESTRPKRHFPKTKAMPS